MIKRNWGLLLMVALVALAMPSSALAAKFSYQSGIQVQNLSGSTATIAVSYYNSQTAATNPAQVAATKNDTILANQSTTYFPIEPGSGFNGSVVISSDQPLASIVNLLASTGSTFKGADSYVGAAAGSTTIQLPLLMKGNASGTLDTWFTVQNAGSGKTSVKVVYSDGTSLPAVALEANAAYTFDQQSETHSQKVFSAVVTSTNELTGTTAQPLVAVAVQEASSGTVLAYSGFTAGSKAPVLPLINTQLARGSITGVLVKNTGAASTNVTITYVPATGSGSAAQCTETQTIAGGSLAVFAMNAFSGAALPAGGSTTCVGNATFKMVGSGFVSANSGDQDLVVVVNQVGGVTGSAYAGFDPNTATNKVVFPLIMDRNSGIFTGYTIMSLGAASTTVTCTYSGVATTFDDTATLSQNQTMVKLQNNHFTGMAKYVGSATCTGANAGDKLIGVVNEVSVSSADTLLTYSGINN